MRLLDSLRRAVRANAALRRVRLARFGVLARAGLHQDFASFVKPDEALWRDALVRAQSGKRVLIATNLGGHFALSAIDRMLAVALTLRGAAVTTVLCDSVLPACQMAELDLTPDLRAFARNGPDALLCGYCHAPAEAKLKALGLSVARLGAHADVATRAEARRIASQTALDAIESVEWRGVNVGEHASAGALRFFARGDLDGEPYGETVLRRFVEAAIVATDAYLKLIDTVKPEVLVAHHGIYVPQGLAAAAARARGVGVVTWNPAYRRSCFIFSHDDSYHYTLMNEPQAVWREAPFGPREREQITRYLESRREGKDDWIQFHRPDSAQPAQSPLGLDASKPLVLALTNVFWDAQLHYPANAFASQLDWLKHTIAWFAGRPDLQLAIRVHPAEITGSPASRQRAEPALRAIFPEMPKNVTIFGPEAAISTYALADRSNAALIYGTKMGVELSARGLPVIVAGEAWARGKGFTIDVDSAAAYHGALARLPLARLSSEQQELALRYARHFFFRRMIEVGLTAPAPGARRFDVTARDLADLQTGRDLGLDVICNGILKGAPFLAENALDA